MMRAHTNNSASKYQEIYGKDSKNVAAADIERFALCAPVFVGQYAISLVDRFTDAHEKCIFQE